MTDFSVPQRMSAGAFLIIFAKAFKRFLSLFVVISAIEVFKAEIDEDFWQRFLVCFGTFIALAFSFACAKYFSIKFYVKGGNLIFRHGLMVRETSTIPLTRIHALRTSRGIIYQLLGMRGVTFDTLATNAEEIELILTEADWQSLMNLIEREERPQTETTDEAPPIFAPTMRFDNNDLLLDALCQNHLKGATVLFGFAAVVYDYANDVIENFAEKIADYAEYYVENTAFSPFLIAAFLVSAYFIVLVLWLGKVILRYYDTSLTIGKTLLTFNYGLLSRSSCRFSFDKVCTIWVKRNILEKHLGLCTLMLRQALYATANKEEDNLKLYGRDRSNVFLKWWLGDDYADSPILISSKSGRGVLLHSTMKALAVSAVVAMILCYFQLFVWLFAPVLYLLIYIARGFGALYHSRITLRETYIMVEDGCFADIRNYLKYENLDVVRLTRTPFTRFFHRVTLVLSTSGTTFKIRSLKEEEAKMIYELLLYKSEIAAQ